MLAIALLAGVSGAARAADLRAQADLGAGYDDEAMLSRRYVRQVYQLRYARQVSLPISYRLSLLYQDDRQALSSPGVGDERQRASELAPAAFLGWQIDGFSLTANASVSDGRIYDGERGATISRGIQRYGASTRVRLMPDGNLTGYATRLAYSGTEVDTRRDMVGLGFEWTRGPLRIVNLNVGDRYEDRASRVVRTSAGPRLSARYTRNEGPWAVGARYDFEYQLTEQTSHTALTTMVPSDVPPAAGLYLVFDDLPADSPAMTVEPRLVDGVLEASAGVNVGPGGSASQNVGIDMGRTVALEGLVLHVRNGAGQPVPFAGPVTWTVWSSADGASWAPIGATPAFDAVRSAYVLTFVTTSARYFKAVNFEINTVDTFVTELQPYVRATFLPDQTVQSRAIRHGVGVDLGANLAAKARLSYIGQLHAGELTAFKGNSVSTRDLSNAVALHLGPWGPFTTEVAGTQLQARTAVGVEQNKLAASVATTYQPIERFTAKLQGRWMDERVRRAHAITTGVGVSSSATVYDALRAGASLDASRQEVSRFGSTDFVTATAYVGASVRSDVEVRLDAAAQRSVSTSGSPALGLADVPLLQTVTYERYTADVRYRPSIQLDLFGRVGYASTSMAEGTIWKARADWQPLPGGALRLASDYDVEFDPLTGRSYRQLSVQPQWLVNRQATLSLRYNDIRGTGGGPARQQSVNAFLSITL